MWATCAKRTSEEIAGSGPGVSSLIATLTLVVEDLGGVIWQFVSALDAPEVRCAEDVWIWCL